MTKRLLVTNVIATSVIQRHDVISYRRLDETPRMYSERIGTPRMPAQ